MKKSEKLYICYDAGSDIYLIEKFNPSIEWHRKEFKGTYSECLKEKNYQELYSYRFNNFKHN